MFSWSLQTPPKQSRDLQTSPNSRKNTRYATGIVIVHLCRSSVELCAYQRVLVIESRSDSGLVSDLALFALKWPVESHFHLSPRRIALCIQVNMVFAYFFSVLHWDNDGVGIYVIILFKAWPWLPLAPLLLDRAVLFAGSSPMGSSGSHRRRQPRR